MEQETLTGFSTGYPQGNMERWSYIVTSYLPQAWTTLVKTVDPIIYAALIELLGSNTRFDKQSGNIQPILDKENNLVGLNATLLFTVPDFAGFSGDPSAIQHDQQFILQKCQTVPSIQWNDNSVQIDVETGHVTVIFTIPLA